MWPSLNLEPVVKLPLVSAKTDCFVCLIIQITMFITWTVMALWQKYAKWEELNNTSKRQSINSSTFHQTENKKITAHYFEVLPGTDWPPPPHLHLPWGVIGCNQFSLLRVKETVSLHWRWKWAGLKMLSVSCHNSSSHTVQLILWEKSTCQERFSYEKDGHRCWYRCSKVHLHFFFLQMLPSEI